MDLFDPETLKALAPVIQAALTGLAGVLSSVAAIVWNVRRRL